MNTIDIKRIAGCALVLTSLGLALCASQQPGAETSSGMASPDAPASQEDRSGTNAALLFWQAYHTGDLNRKVDHFSRTYDVPEILSGSAEHDWEESSPPGWAHRYTRNSALGTLRAAAEADYCDFGVRTEFGIASVATHLNAFRDIERVLAMHTVAYAERGDGAGVARSLLTMMQIARQVVSQRDCTPFESLVASASTRTLEQALSNPDVLGSLKDTDRDRLIEELGWLESRDPFQMRKAFRTYGRHLAAHLPSVFQLIREENMDFGEAIAHYNREPFAPAGDNRGQDLIWHLVDMDRAPRTLTREVRDASEKELEAAIGSIARFVDDMSHDFGLPSDQAARVTSTSQQGIVGRYGFVVYRLLIQWEPQFYRQYMQAERLDSDRIRRVMDLLRNG